MYLYIISHILIISTLLNLSDRMIEMSPTLIAFIMFIDIEII